jgi:hypothetical protein
MPWRVIQLDRKTNGNMRERARKKKEKENIWAMQGARLSLSWNRTPLSLERLWLMAHEIPSHGGVRVSPAHVCCGPACMNVADTRFTAYLRLFLFKTITPFMAVPSVVFVYISSRLIT